MFGVRFVIYIEQNTAQNNKKQNNKKEVENVSKNPSPRK